MLAIIKQRNGEIVGWILGKDMAELSSRAFMAGGYGRLADYLSGQLSTPPPGKYALPSAQPGELVLLVQADSAGGGQ